MKKLSAFVIILMLLGTISVSATPFLIQNKPFTIGNGSFASEIGYLQNKEWVKVGDLSGIYEQKNKYYKFEGMWEITTGDYKGTTGTMLGGFGKHILIGKITITDSGKNAPIIGFIVFNESTSTFFGRFMSVVGPALFFKGTMNSLGYTNNINNFGVRYKHEIFSNVNITSNITYGANVDSNGTLINLLVDIYEPSGDSLQKRPTLLIIHGGGFTQGDKTSAQIVKLCTDFAKRGYVTASINYRLQPPDNIDYQEAIKQAMYDAKAAIRYLRATATLWRIDTEKIAVIGSSAGAVTALHTSYLTGLDYEGDSGNPGFSSNVSACVDLWGGLYQNINAINAGEPPVLIIHGTEDKLVNYSEAVNISQRCEEVGVHYELHPLEGKGHGPWKMSVFFIPWIVDFLYTYCAQTKSTRTANTIDLVSNTNIFFMPAL